MFHISAIQKAYCVNWRVSSFKVCKSSRPSSVNRQITGSAQSAENGFQSSTCNYTVHNCLKKVLIILMASIV